MESAHEAAASQDKTRSAPDIAVEAETADRIDAEEGQLDEVAPAAESEAKVDQATEVGSVAAEAADEQRQQQVEDEADLENQAGTEARRQGRRFNPFKTVHNFFKKHVFGGIGAAANRAPPVVMRMMDVAAGGIPPPVPFQPMQRPRPQRVLGAWTLLYNRTDGWIGDFSDCNELGRVIGGYTEERKRSTVKTYLKKKYLVSAGSDTQVKLDIIPLGHWQNAYAVMAVNGKPCWTTIFNGRQECGEKGQKILAPLAQATAQCGAVAETGVLDVEVYAHAGEPNDEEFSEPFGIRNVLVFAWQVPCQRSNCPTGATLKEPPPMCKGACTSAICCDAGPMCSEDVCPPDFMFKLEPVRHCNSGGCAVEDCCDARAKCNSNTCKPTEGWVRKTQNSPPFCKKSSCNVTECCNPLPRCTDDVCAGVMGKVMVTSPPQFCVTERCSLVECCETLPKCSPLDCDRTTGSVLRKHPPHFCANRGCTSLECCQSPEQCSANDCPTNAVLKVPDEMPTFCAGFKCKWQECCDMLPTCTQDVCGAAELKGLPPTHCIHRTCTKVECCKVVTEDGGKSGWSMSLPWTSSDKGDKADDHKSQASGPHTSTSSFLVVLTLALSRALPQQ